MKEMKKNIGIVLLVTVLAVSAGVGVAFLTAPDPKVAACGSSSEKKSDCSDEENGKTEKCDDDHLEDEAVTEKSTPLEKSASEEITAVKDTTPVAKVNGISIQKYVLESAMKDRRESGDSSVTLREDILDNLITVELLYQEAKKSGIQLSPGAGAIRADAVKRAQKDSGQFETLLSDRGLTPEEYRHQWYRQATINMYIEEQIQASVTVKERTLKKLYSRLNKSSEKPVERSFEESRSILHEMYVKEKTKQLVDKKIAFLKQSSDISIL